MKRLIIIFCCFFVVFAGAASAWADCKKLNFVADDHHSSQRALPAHQDHSDSQHDHSHGTIIHCATLDGFLLSPVFSLTKDNRVYRADDFVVAAVNLQLTKHVSDWLSHGPPGFFQSGLLPPYLFLSVLRI